MEITPIQTRTAAKLDPAQEVKLRDAARQFEAVLLTQLTSVLNNTGSEEDSLFGTDGGSDLAKKLFSEQLATAMADSGGIGLANTLLRQFGLEPSNQITKKSTVSNAIGQNSPVPKQVEGPLVINRSGRVNPVSDEWLKSEVAEIISTDTGDDESWRAAFANPANGIDYTNPANMTSTSAASSNYVMPVEGRFSSRFGNRFHPVDRTQKFHSGIDIAAPRGTPIKAAADGIVVFAGQKGGYGNVVEIKHADGRVTRYAHADALNVTEGQKVTAGEQIATVGSTGKTTGPHLHFEVLENGQAVNPFETIFKGF